MARAEVVKHVATHAHRTRLRPPLTTILRPPLTTILRPPLTTISNPVHRVARAEVVKHVAVHAEEFARMTARPVADLMARLVDIAVPGTPVFSLSLSLPPPPLSLSLSLALSPSHT